MKGTFAKGANEKVAQLLQKSQDEAINEHMKNHMSFKSFKRHIEVTNGYSKYVGLQDSTHVIFFDWLRDDSNKIEGFKYAVACDITQATKAEVLNAMYNWIFKDINLDFYIRYKYAITNNDRFKKPLSLNF